MDHHDNEKRERAAMVDLGGNEAVRRVVLRKPAELHPLAEKVDNWMRVLGYSGKDIFAVRLALGEAALNAFRHGNLGDPDKVVRVNYLVTAAEVIVEVEDDGPGFDPSQIPDPLHGNTGERISGRGLFLMRVYMSGVIFNRQGNRVTLWRHRSPADRT
jgi:serine/threonine-protein kinase RsbW